VASCDLVASRCLFLPSLEPSDELRSHDDANDVGAVAQTKGPAWQEIYGWLDGMPRWCGRGRCHGVSCGVLRSSRTIRPFATTRAGPLRFFVCSPAIRLASASRCWWGLNHAVGSLPRRPSVMPNSCGSWAGFALCVGSSRASLGSDGGPGSGGSLNGMGLPSPWKTRQPRFHQLLEDFCAFLNLFTEHFGLLRQFGPRGDALGDRSGHLTNRPHRIGQFR